MIYYTLIETMKDLGQMIEGHLQYQGSGALYQTDACWDCANDLDLT